MMMIGDLEGDDRVDRRINVVIGMSRCTAAVVLVKNAQEEFSNGLLVQRCLYNIQSLQAREK